MCFNLFIVSPDASSDCAELDSTFESTDCESKLESKLENCDSSPLSDPSESPPPIDSSP